MPRFFFDTHNGGFHRDNVGTDCASLDAARAEAVKSLPEIARFDLPTDGDCRACTILVRTEGGAIVYVATLTFAGALLTGDAGS